MLNIFVGFIFTCGSIAVSWTEGGVDNCRDGLSNQDATYLIESLSKRGIEATSFIGSCD